MMHVCCRYCCIGLRRIGHMQWVWSSWLTQEWARRSIRIVLRCIWWRNSRGLLDMPGFYRRCVIRDVRSELDWNVRHMPVIWVVCTTLRVRDGSRLLNSLLRVITFIMKYLKYVINLRQDSIRRRLNSLISQ